MTPFFIPRIRRMILMAFTISVNLMAQQPVRFAVIGDYGDNSQPELDVANRLKSWGPEFIITNGDNNYDYGSASTIDTNIGKYYHEFISPYHGSYGSGDTVNRFFPSLGNHDWLASGATPYLNYFTLPGNERYYDFVRGCVHFFCIDSDPHEPNGNSSSSTQALWLQNRLAASTAQWKIVYFHHAPYSSGTSHGSYETMQWPFKEWGAHAVLAGHEHNYERILRDSIVYFVNGSGGKSLYGFGTPILGSIIRYNANYGAQLVDATADSIRFTFITRSGVTIDSYTLYKPTNSSSIKVNKGWNMLSLPLAISDTRLSSIFPTAASMAYRYTDGFYLAKDSLERGIGYWVKFNNNQSVPLQGDTIHLDSIEVLEGWNLIGTISDTVPAPSIIKIPEDLIISSIFKFTTTYQQTDTLIPGKAYWIKVQNNGILVLPGNLD